MSSLRTAKCNLYSPTLSDAIAIAGDLPSDEIEQVELLHGAEFSPETQAMWFFNTHFKIGCRTNEGKPIAVCGFSPINPGVYRTFFLATNYAWQHHGRELTLLTVRGMNDIVEREGIRRLETLCLASREKAQSWYSMLGLKHESTLEAFAVNGDDAVLFTRVVE